jgi:hypothetical protein
VILLKQKEFAILLVSGCIALLSACGSPTESTPVSASEPVTFGTSEIASTPEYAAETTDIPEAASSAQEEAVPATPEPEPDAALYDAAIAAAVRCEAGENLPYDPTDPMYFWRAMGYFLGSIADAHTAITCEDGAYTISASDVPQFAYVLFGDFDGTIPSVTEEDPLVSLGEDDTYVIHLPDLEDQTLQFSEPVSQGDGTYTVTIELYQDGALTATYTAMLRDYDGLSAYSLTGLSKAS